MKFGKTTQLDSIDFSLPADPALTKTVLSGLPVRTDPPRIYAGCTGWSMKEWTGNVYPAGTKAKDFLKFYGKQFNTIELNTTHYRIPAAEMISKWKDLTPRDFRFCPKVVNQVSHARDMGIESGKMMDFCNSITGLEERLGPCFMQLPPYFGADRYAVLESFLRQWPKDIRLAVEVRHESWFETEAATTRLLELLRAYHVGAVITDVAGRRDVAHMGITTSFAMVRWVGNGLIDSDYERIDTWTDRLLEWTNAGLHEIYFFPHEPDNILAPEITLYLTQKIQSAIPTAIIRGPELPYVETGSQLGLF